MWITALLLGFSGSLHCIGMCSPLALAVTGRSKNALFNRLLYHSGRVLTYGILGAVVGAFGMLLPFSQWQNFLSVLLGCILIGIGIAGFRHITIPFVTPASQYVSTHLKIYFTRFLQRKNYASTILLGALNGLLPCGLTFLGFTYCLTLVGPADGFYFMLLFGVGTLPALLGLASVFQLLIAKFEWSAKRMTTILLIVSGTLLIARIFVPHPHANVTSHGPVDIVVCR